MIAPDPIAFSVFGLKVHWYGILIASALLIGLLIAIKRAPKYGIDPDTILDFFLFMTPAIVIGARLYYVVFNYAYYVDHPGEIIATWDGGLAIHGGIIAGVIVAIILCRVKKIRFMTFADAVIVGLPLGQAIGRWGNFFNQEAYGTQTNLPWAITVNDAALGMIRVHPTFLYESIWDLLVFGCLFFYERKLKKADGELLFVYLGLYSIGRFFIEGLRTDSLMFLGLRTAQLISLLLVIVAGIGLCYLRKNENRFPNSLKINK
ncbi:prolipoprotein diacylglyceryl transferase [Acetobacterium paludosum]|uniref:Phosphatidylglycerol--prolipoprotein diacylglyceryl transferase n=1 Tax=Acetobacterium paludosum TaxID=52693 RepID=A0A923HZX9_9FIRM|nr:prolipoprotein diacylglyceryl transferase [Acetobacterium paludosum]MBC3889106.1 prolipoprotein diacylglyceryl transferase [Acetobacterium paludosum]